MEMQTTLLMRRGLTFAELIKAMHEIIKSNGYYCQRDTMLDIALLSKTHDGTKGSFGYIWCVREEGARLSEYGDDWENDKFPQHYDIQFVYKQGWSIEKIA